MEQGEAVGCSRACWQVERADKLEHILEEGVEEANPLNADFSAPDEVLLEEAAVEAGVWTGTHKASMVAGVVEEEVIPLQVYCPPSASSPLGGLRWESALPRLMLLLQPVKTRLKSAWQLRKSSPSAWLQPRQLPTLPVGCYLLTQLEFSWHQIFLDSVKPLDRCPCDDLLLHLCRSLCMKLAQLRSKGLHSCSTSDGVCFQPLLAVLALSANAMSSLSRLCLPCTNKLQPMI